MTLETMTKAEAEAKPAGEGREDPNTNPTLEEPKLVCKNLPAAANFILYTFVYTTVMNLEIIPILNISPRRKCFHCVVC